MLSDQELIDGLRVRVGDTPAKKRPDRPLTRACRSRPTTRSAVSVAAPSAMAPHLQRGGCDGLCARRAGCRRRRAGAAQRPSPVGSTHRPFTARVADALVERLAGELPTRPGDRAGRRAAQEQAPRRPRRATRGRPRDHTAPRSAGRADAGENGPAEASVSETGSRAVALGPGSAPMPSWSWRRITGHRSARQGRHSPPRRTSSGRGRKPAQQGPEGDQMVCSIHLQRLSPAASAPAHRRSSPERGTGGRMRGKLRAARARPRWAARAPRRRPSRPSCDQHWVEHRHQRGRDQLGLDRASRLRVGAARVRQMHARQRRAQLPRPKPRGRNALRDAGWNQSLVACVQGSADEVSQAPARRRPPQLGAPTFHTYADEAAADR